MNLYYLMLLFSILIFNSCKFQNNRAACLNTLEYVIDGPIYISYDTTVVKYQDNIDFNIERKYYFSLQVNNCTEDSLTLLVDVDSISNIELYHPQSFVYLKEESGLNPLEGGISDYYLNKERIISPYNHYTFQFPLEKYNENADMLEVQFLYYLGVGFNEQKKREISVRYMLSSN